MKIKLSPSDPVEAHNQHNAAKTRSFAAKEHNGRPTTGPEKKQKNNNNNKTKNEK